MRVSLLVIPFYALSALSGRALGEDGAGSRTSTKSSGEGEAATRIEADRALLARIEDALTRSATFLLSRQSEDGSWRSTTYGALKDGYALTPIVMSALLFAPEAMGRSIMDPYRRGADFIATLSKDDGTLAGGPFGLSYPVYSLSGALLVLSVPANRRHARARDALIDHLRGRQLAEDLGWSPSDPSYGGWGYSHDRPQKPKIGGPTDELLSANLTSTLFAVGALQLAGVPLDDPLFAKARVFVRRCQNFPKSPRRGSPQPPIEDGGFFFTPESEIQNKAGLAPSEGNVRRFRSYGTTTADGLRALLRLGHPRDDPRVKAAVRWLLDRFTMKEVPGEYASDREVQRESAYFYWSWSAAHALMLVGPVAETAPKTREWPRVISEALLEHQHADGSWQNAAKDVREDDPIVGTSLAASALEICRMMLGGRFATSIPM